MSKASKLIQLGDNIQITKDRLITALRNTFQHTDMCMEWLDQIVTRVKETPAEYVLNKILFDDNVMLAIAQCTR